MNFNRDLQFFSDENKNIIFKVALEIWFCPSEIACWIEKTGTLISSTALAAH